MEKDFERLRQEIENCRLCNFEHRPTPIFWGHQKVKILQVSQAPSAKADKISQPFVDQSGQTLREWYGIPEETFYDKDLFYLTALGHCFPGKNGRGDAKPPLNCARLWLGRELETVDSEIYVAIGSQAAGNLFPKRNFSEMVFSDQVFNGKKALVLPHPSPANIFWFKKNPRFLTERMPEIRTTVQKVLGSGR